MDDPFTMSLELCGPDGLADLATLNRLRALGGHPPYEGAPICCTGSAHLAGEHIRCTSEAHSRPLPAPMLVNHRRDGIACVAVANDVRSLLADDPDVPAEFLTDLDTVERVGRTLYFQVPITLPAMMTVATVPATGP